MMQLLYVIYEVIAIHMVQSHRPQQPLIEMTGEFCNSFRTVMTNTVIWLITVVFGEQWQMAWFVCFGCRKKTFRLSIWLIKEDTDLLVEEIGVVSLAPLTLHSDTAWKWNEWSLFPSTARTLKRWQLAAREAWRNVTHFSPQTGLISKLAFNIDVSNPTGCCDDRLDGIFNRPLQKELLCGSYMSGAGLPLMHTDNKPLFCKAILSPVVLATEDLHIEPIENMATRCSTWCDDVCFNLASASTNQTLKHCSKFLRRFK